MWSSGEDPNKGIGASVGGLVWVRRRDGSWWPGKILGLDELPEGCVPRPRSGTPVKLLGREDASVDWYNLEKLKRVKAFHCGDCEDCIEKSKPAASHLSKKRVKYAQRPDAILHALELESAHLGINHADYSDPPDTQNGEHHYDHGSPSAIHPSEESQDVDEDLNSFEDDSDLAQEPFQSGISFEERDCVDPEKEGPKKWKTPNNSEDDGAGGVKCIKGLEDLGMDVASSPKRKRSLVVHVHDILKRKNRQRTLTKVLESTTMVAIPVVCEKMSSPTGPSVMVASDSKISGFKSNELKNNNNTDVISNNSGINGISHENGKLSNASRLADAASLGCEQKDFENSGMLGVPSHELSQRLFDVPIVAEEKQSAGFSSIISDASQKALVGAGAQSSRSNHVETLSLGNECSDFGSTSSGTAYDQQISEKIEKGTSEWQLKGKRNSRSRKVDLDNEADVYMAGVDGETALAGSCRNVDSNHADWSFISDYGGGYNVKSRPITEIQVEEFCGWSWNSPQKESHIRGTTAELLVPQRQLPYRRSRLTVNPKYDSSDFSLGHHMSGSGLYDVTVKVKTIYRPQHVPYISLMSKLNGQPIIGHPLTIEVLDDGFCDDLINISKHHSGSLELDFNLSEDLSALQGIGMVYERKPRGRPPSKHGSFRAHWSLKKSSRNGLVSKKTRKLSSLTGSHRLNREQKKSAAVKLRGPSIACVPLTVVFSRINASLNSSMRSLPRLVTTGSI